MKKSFLILFFLVCSYIVVSDSHSQVKSLYFCEKYENGREIGISDKFTTGWLTVMLDLRESGESIGVSSVDILIIKINDNSGKEVCDTIDFVPFDVEPDWDYIYFTDEERLIFEDAGTYNVVCITKSGTPIANGEVQIVYQ